MLGQEYQRRLSQSGAADALESQEKQLALATRRVKAQEDRLLDAYKNEAIDLPRLKEEMGKQRARREALDREMRGMEQLRQQQAQGAHVLERLTFEERQKLLRLLVDRIQVDGDHVRVEGIIPLQASGREAVLRPTRADD